MRTYRPIVLACVLSTLSGCTSMSLASALATPKNARSAYADPTVKDFDNQDRIILANYNTLLEATNRNNAEAGLQAVGDTDMRRYLGAGFALSDIYCKRFFRATDEAYRRRKFGRTLTNDAGTAVTTLLGLVNAGESAVTALAAATGLADSTWRNYDDSFIISPQLSVVRTLVLAAQDNFRARTLGQDATLPADFGTAQTVIERYSEHCSFLGMQALLEQSATKQQDTLKDDTEKRNSGNSGGPGAFQEPGAAPAAPATALPATATPAITPNVPSGG